MKSEIDGKLGRYTVHDENYMNAKKILSGWKLDIVMKMRVKILLEFFI